MKRSVSSVVAAAVGLGLAIPLMTATPAMAAKSVKSKSSPTITAIAPADTGAVVFSGKVKASKKKSICRAKRKVTLTQVEQKLVAGKAKTDKKGQWKVTFDGETIAPGPFKVQVAKKVVKQKGKKKVVCKGGKRTYTLEQIEKLLEQSLEQPLM
ncbi:hypothetical protein [Nocardioides alcanivorans]|uniref:hypothetical protein n=1 Tax=Nocardioides alcanivorans TaxID=2897352 RepID=UPI001F4843D6|nr:hypothetical protein [Nocardioides alcanivorans]